MILIIRDADSVIVGNISYMSDPSLISSIEAGYVGHTLIEIPDEEFQEDMIGAIYNG